MKRTENSNVIVVCMIILLSALTAQAQLNPGVDFDLQGFINQKITAGETNIVIPPGRYRVDANNRTAHLYFEDLNNITVIADGVEMICTETVQAIQINNCTNFILKGLTIDYDPLPFTQARIVDLSSDKKTITAEFIDGYSTDVNGDKVEIFDPLTGELSTATYYGASYTVDKAKNQVVISKNSGGDEEIGDIVVLGSEFGRARPHAILPDNCTGLVLEDVTLYAGTSFGYFETNCRGSIYINCRVDRRPVATEVKERGIRRMRSTNADAFHSKFAAIGPSYESCIARYCGDDGIAINGHFHVITETNGNILSVVGREGKTPDLYKDDIVELVSYTGERIPDAKIISIVQERTLTSAETTFLQNQTFYGSVSKTADGTNKIYYVTLDRVVDLPMGSLINSANGIGNGFEIKNCILGPNRSRGILLQASNGTVTGNTCIDNWGSGIKVAPEYGWLAAGNSNNVIISDNVITGCHDVGIGVYAYGGDGSTAPVGAHSNITITGNSIIGSTNPGIAVTSTSNLTVNYNTVNLPNNDLLVPWNLNKFGRKVDPNREIYMENVQIKENYDLLVHFECNEESTATELINTGTETNVFAGLITDGGTLTPGVVDEKKKRCCM